MKEANTQSERHASTELTGRPESSYAKSRISHPTMPDATNPHTTDNPQWDPIDTLNGGSSQPSIQEAFDEAVRLHEKTWLAPPTQAQMDEIRASILAQRAAQPSEANSVSGARQKEAPAAQAEDLSHLPPGVAEMVAGTTNTSRRKEQEKAYRNPDDLDEILEAVAAYDTEFHRDFPLFTLTNRDLTNAQGKAILDEEGNPKKEKIIHDANFLRYVRKRMRFFESEEGPDTKINYFSHVGIEFGPRSISIQNLIGQESKYFKDSKGVIHEELAQQIRREMFVRTIVRGRDIDYRTGGKGMGDDGGIAGIMGSLFKDNNMTRNMWYGKSMWHWLLEMPQEMKLKEVTGHGEPKLERDDIVQDTRLGRGIATGMMAYYHLADFTKLQEMLGKNSSFFTKDGFKKIRDSIADEELKANPFAAGEEQLDALRNKVIKDSDLDKIFTKDKGINYAEFSKYVNFFTEAQVDPRRRDMVRGLLRQAIGEKYKLYIPGTTELDTESISLAEEYAYLTTRWSGAAARNDLGAAAYDAQAKILRTQQYRIKQASDTRGGAFGNLYNVGLFKTLGVNYLDSIRTQDGQLMREVLEELVKVDVAGAEDEVALKAEQQESRGILSKLNFPDASESNFVNNGVNRWFGEFESFIGGKELHLQKVVEWATLRGVVYDPAQFGELIQEGFLKPLRYGYSTWPNLYNKQVRDMVKYDPAIHEGMPTVSANNETYIFQDMSLAESMLGDQVLDVQDFWHHGEPLLDKDKKQKKDKDGKPMYQKYYKHTIDAERINGNRPQLFKQMALSRIAADIYSHRDRNSPYPYWDSETVEALIKALERVPGGLLNDENNLQNSMITKYFFTDADIKYLRSLGGVTHRKVLMKDGGMAVAKQGGKTLWKFAQAMFKGLK